MLFLLLALQDIPFEPLLPQAVSLEAKPLERVIRDAKGWKDFWTECNGDKIPAPPQPELDFKTEAVVAVVWGVKPSSGYTVQIVRIEAARDVLLVHVRRRSPPPGKGQLAVLTAPAAFVRAKLPDLPVKFVEAKEK